MESTNNFSLKVYEGTDLFNPLTTENENTVAIDEQMFKNQNAGIQTATELVSGTVHAITRSVPDASVFRFTAVSRFTAGDTFTVDDIQVSALTTSGEQIPDGAFIIGSEVIGVLKGTLLTLYISMTKANTAKDADKLGGQLPGYYGSAAAVSQAQETAAAAGTLSAQNEQAINEINGNLAQLENAFNSTKWVNVYDSAVNATPLTRGARINFDRDISSYSEIKFVYKYGATGFCYTKDYFLDARTNNNMLLDAPFSGANIYSAITTSDLLSAKTYATISAVGSASHVWLTGVYVRANTI